MPTILENIIAAYKNPAIEPLKDILTEADPLVLG
jgi:hypothetical protein